MDVDASAEPRTAAPAAAVHPRTVMIPGPAVVITAAAHVCDTTGQSKLPARQGHGGEENEFDVFHG
jgi:hypothetical protein